jgi:hypothetical protein
VALAPPSVAIPVRRSLRLTALPQWWHLLSLDAPTVAALWSWSIARALGVRLPLSAPLLLALGTWLVYVADRILDGRVIDSVGDSVGDSTGASSFALRERHFFYARHRGAFLIASVPVGVLLLWLILTRMNPTARHEDVAVFGVALVYFCVVHVYGPAAERWLPKELAVGAVFAVATAVPAWSRLPTASGLTSGEVFLILTVCIFAVLCWLNCVAIEKWERRRDAAAAGGELRSPVPHRSTRWAQRRLRGLCCGIAVAAVVCAGGGSLIGVSPAVPAIFLACAMTGTGFAALDYWQEHLRISAFHLRIAADAVMLTPLAFIFIHR